MRTRILTMLAAAAVMLALTGALGATAASAHPATTDAQGTIAHPLEDVWPTNGG